MPNPTLIQLIGALLFALAVIHTFSTKFFEQLAHAHPRHALEPRHGDVFFDAGGVDAARHPACQPGWPC